LDAPARTTVDAYREICSPVKLKMERFWVGPYIVSPILMAMSGVILFRGRMLAAMSSRE